MNAEPRAGLAELTRSSMEATNAHRFAEAMDAFAATAEFDVTSAGLGVFRGREAIRRYLEDWIGAYEEQRFAEWEARELGGGVVLVNALLEARPRGSEAAVRERWCFTVVWSDGRIARVIADRELERARERAEELAAAG
jgi:ketosteroid isomerase-like protein